MHQVHFAASIASGMSRLFGVAMEKLGPLAVCTVLRVAEGPRPPAGAAASHPGALPG